MELPPNARTLDRLVREHGFRRGAELGVRRGELTASLLERNPALEMLAVDLWADHPSFTERYDHAANLAQFRQNVRGFEARVVVLRALIVEAAERVGDESLDFVFVDATHTAGALQADLEAWAPKVKATGLIAGHDYHPAWDGGRLIRCVDAAFREKWLADDSCWFGWKQDLALPAGMGGRTRP